MIPKNSTPIKNKILIDIIGKGLLSLTEIRIIAYIIRWSWGFDGIERRRDFTKKITKREIANSLGMHESLVNRNINRMIREKKLIVKDRCYQFNEHYEEWEYLTKSQVLNDKKLDKKSNKTCQKVKQSLTKSQTKLDKKSSLGMPNNQKNTMKNKGFRGGEHLFKESIKKYIKESIKKGNTSNKNKIIFDYEKGKFIGLTESYIKELQREYKCDVKKELVKMREWLLDNPDKKRKGRRLFIRNWLERTDKSLQKEVDDLPLLK